MPPSSLQVSDSEDKGRSLETEDNTGAVTEGSPPTICCGVVVWEDVPNSCIKSLH